MSLILKGIDLPKDGKIEIEISPTGLVWVDKGEEYYCLKDLAIQIPKGHGRLKDVSELEKDGGFAWRLSLTPTILEAEE